MTNAITKLDELYAASTPGPWNLDNHENFISGPTRDGGWDWIAIGEIYHSLNTHNGSPVDTKLVVALHNTWPAIREVLKAARTVKSAYYDDALSGDNMRNLTEALAALDKAAGGES